MKSLPFLRLRLQHLVFSSLGLLGAGLTMWWFTGCAHRAPLRPVASVDLSRYRGKWYEVARYPHWFQRHCTGVTTADYTLLKDGTICVVNRCQTKDGGWREVRGTARVVPGSNQARLKVTFGLPLAGDYWIIGLDEENYQWAVVGHPSRWFLWFLAREPKVSAETLEKMLRVAEAQGFRRERLLIH